MVDYIDHRRRLMPHFPQLSLWHWPLITWDADAGYHLRCGWPWASQMLKAPQTWPIFYKSASCGIRGGGRRMGGSTRQKMNCTPESWNEGVVLVNLPPSSSISNFSVKIFILIFEHTALILLFKGLHSSWFLRKAKAVQNMELQGENII